MLASTYDIYQRIASGEIKDMTVPAINVRTGTLPIMRRVFRQAKQNKIGVVILELALGESAYTGQTPEEYKLSAYVAAMMEGYTGNIYLQADHYQIKPEPYLASPSQSRAKIQQAIVAALKGGQRSIDLDESFLVALPEENFREQVADAEEEAAPTVSVQQQREQERQLRKMAEKAYGKWKNELGQQTIDRIKEKVKKVLVEYAANGFYKKNIQAIDEKLTAAPGDKGLLQLKTMMENFVQQIGSATSLDA
ncbi:MAG: hypothetical protein ABSH12_02440, partial [Endomicrobiales bacterium]